MRVERCQAAQVGRRYGLGCQSAGDRLSFALGSSVCAAYRAVSPPSPSRGMLMLSMATIQIVAKNLLGLCAAKRMCAVACLTTMWNCACRCDWAQSLKAPQRFKNRIWAVSGGQSEHAPVWLVWVAALSWNKRTGVSMMRLGITCIRSN